MSLLSLASDRLRQRLARGRMTMERALAEKGEDLAQRFLEKRGFRVVARNYRGRAQGNEADLIAWHGDRLAIIEVKTRSGDQFGTPDRAITPEKRRRIVLAGLDYARRADVDPAQLRFDIVTVLDGSPRRIEWFEDAFGASSIERGFPRA